MSKHGSHKAYKYGDYDEFRVWLIEANYSTRTVSRFLKGIYTFTQEGYELNEENIGKWKEKLLQDGMEKKKIGDFTAGVKKYILFLNGEQIVNRYNKFQCNDDCFNCPYPDCLKPDYMMV